MGLEKRPIPILVNGGIDTKTASKLVAPPGLLELENLDESQTGELRARNGMNSLPGTMNTPGGIFADANGGLAAINRGFALNSYANAAKYASSTPWGYTDWEPPASTGRRMVYPTFTARVLPVSSDATEAGVGLATVADLRDPDAAYAQGVVAVSWTDAGNSRQVMARFDASALKRLQANGTLGVPGARPPVVAASGTSTPYITLFGVDNGAPGTIWWSNTAGLSGSLGAANVSAAQPWLDCQGYTTGAAGSIAVAYRATGGGVTVLVLVASTGAVAAGPVNIAAADASMCLGWLNNSANSSSLYLVTAGSASGVVVRRLDPATLAVQATNVIDATVTANVRQVTGHVKTGANDYVVLWDVSNATTIYDTVKRGAWTGAAAVAEIAPSLSLYTRTFQANDGSWYFVGAYDSSVQPCYIVWPVDTQGQLISFPQCAIAQGEGGGRRASASSLATVVTESAGRYSFPFMRRRSIETPGGASYQSKVVQRAVLTDAFFSLRRPRELGGTLFQPGGQLMRDDGVAVEPATFMLYGEAGTGVGAAFGSMTASSTYTYRTILKKVDASGRVQRSAGSLPWTVTLGAGQQTANLTIPNPRLAMSDVIATMVEIYRAGPAATGDSTYNKVGEVPAGTFAGGNTVTFADTMSDANAELGELAYFNGNTLENFAPPSHSLLEVNARRVCVVNAEDPTEIWLSKEYKAGVGIGFHPDVTLRLDGDGGGGVLALASMDGRLIAFKRSSIWVVSGDGPDDAGRGSFNEPQCVNTDVGTANPGSVVKFSDGVLFQAAQGIYLLDRGMGVSFAGAPVAAYTSAASVVDASTVRGTTQVRFVFANGRCLVYDYFLKRWRTWLLPVNGSTIVGCADSVLHGWCYVLANGQVLREVAGALTDNGATIVPRISFPHLAFAALGGYQRLCGIVFMLDVAGACTVSVDAEYDYSGALSGSPRTKALTATPPGQVIEWNPGEGLQKTTAVRPVLTITGAAASGSFRLTGATAIVGIKRGTRAVATNRMT